MKNAWFNFQHRYAPYIFVAPFALVFTIFGLYPIVKSLILAFYITHGPKASTFVGFSNFTYIFTDRLFWKALTNTAIFTLASLLIQLPLSLGLAMLLNLRWLKGRTIYRFCFFAPYLVGVVFAGVLIPQLFGARYGVVNRVLHFFFNAPLDKDWITNEARVMPAIIVTSLWLYIGFNMMYFLAALQSVDHELYDAAKVDGANAYQRFLHITLPGIRPVLVFVFVLSTIGSFQFFEMPWVMLTESTGPNDSGLFIVTYLFQNGFAAGDLGLASAVGWTLAILVTGFAVLQMYFGGSWKQAE